MFLSYRNNLFDLHNKLTVGVLYNGKNGCMLKLNSCEFFQRVNISNV